MAPKKRDLRPTSQGATEKKKARRSTPTDSSSVTTPKGTKSRATSIGGASSSSATRRRNRLVKQESQQEDDNGVAPLLSNPRNQFGVPKNGDFLELLQRDCDWGAQQLLSIRK